MDVREGRHLPAEFVAQEMNISGLNVFSKTTSEAIDLEGPPPPPEVKKPSSYSPLLVEIVKFFKTGKPPVSEAETLEIYAFMSAADESKRLGGVPVTLDSVMVKARAEAAEILKKKLK